MDKSFDDLVDELKSHGVEFEAGLTDAEVRAAEDTYGFRFPPDLRAFLQTAQPSSRRWANWRRGPDEFLRDRLAWPLEGLLFDLGHNCLWVDAWGPKPDDAAAAEAVLRSAVAAAPTLIPIFGHRMISERPAAAGNPVLSVYQSDIICYGGDLREWVWNEFRGKEDERLRIAEGTPPVEFWWRDALEGVLNGE